MSNLTATDQRVLYKKTSAAILKVKAKNGTTYEVGEVFFFTEMNIKVVCNMIVIPTNKVLGEYRASFVEYGTSRKVCNFDIEYANNYLAK